MGNFDSLSDWKSSPVLPWAHNFHSCHEWCASPRCLFNRRASLMNEKRKLTAIVPVLIAEIEQALVQAE